MTFPAGTLITSDVLETAIGTGDWAAMSLQNSWVPRSGFHTPAYRTLPGGRVELTGSGISGSTASGTTISNLPSGFRPTGELLVPMTANNGHTYALIVRTNGDLDIFTPASPPAWTTFNLSTAFTMDDGGV